MKSRRTPQKNTWRQLLVFAPIVLEVIYSLRQQQLKKRSPYAKPRKREQAFDFALNRAREYFGKNKTRRRI